MKSDHQLRQEVMDELAWDPAVDDKRIGVEVSEGIVTLAGHLSSYAEKYAAQRAVERIGGVRGKLRSQTTHQGFPAPWDCYAFAHAASEF
ncbi:BON domain-containing protein [Herbaspirillum seropedicae]|uniref:BON domain-containing protein n=1 Tax=Herbaspirillum seropedicae TaxID=964 RepID=UPI001123B4EA|nr:BON domain-containing protein [Herbaspirillum seropedicae]